MLLTVEWLRSRPADKYEICGYTMELNCIGQKLSLIFTPLYLLIMMWRGQLMLTAVELCAMAMVIFGSLIFDLILDLIDLALHFRSRHPLFPLLSPLFGKSNGWRDCMLSPHLFFARES